MKLSEAGLELLKEFEGFSATPYADVAGYKTVGYGHLVKKGESFTKITRERAEEILREDVAEAEAIVNQHVKVPLNQNQFDSIVSFVFNIGPGKAGYKDGFVWLRSGRQSTILTLLNQGNMTGAAQQIPNWIYAGGRPSQGLKNRRAREKALFLRPPA